MSNTEMPFFHVGNRGEPLNPSAIPTLKKESASVEGMQTALNGQHCAEFDRLPSLPYQHRACLRF